MTLLPCPKCSTPIQANVQQARIINLPSVSMIVVEHDAFVVCTGCFTRIVPVVAGVNHIAIQAMVVPEESPIISPN